MSIADFATVILMLCGNGTSDKHFDCYDYYNNCVIDANGQIELKMVESCKKNFKTGVVRIQKLKESK